LVCIIDFTEVNKGPGVPPVPPPPPPPVPPPPPSSPPLLLQEKTKAEQHKVNVRISKLRFITGWFK
jgi:hypothetical protein